MSSFSAIEARKASAFVVVPPNAFAAEWSGRPAEPVAVGLRLIPHRDLEGARAVARQSANEALPETNTDDPLEMQVWADAFHDRLLQHIVACGTCDPNDVTEAWSLFAAAPEDMVRQCLTTDGIRLIFDAWEQMRIASDPTQREATDAEVAGLPALLAERGERLAKVRLMRARRLLAFVLAELESVAPVVAATAEAVGGVEAETAPSITQGGAL